MILGEEGRGNLISVEIMLSELGTAQGSQCFGKAQHLCACVAGAGGQAVLVLISTPNPLFLQSALNSAR